MTPKVRSEAASQNQIHEEKWGWLAEHFGRLTKCPVCSCFDWELRFQLGGLFIYRCKGCQVMFLNPFLKPEGMKSIFSSPQSLEKISKFFSGYCEEPSWNTPRTLSIYQSVLKEIEKQDPPGRKLIDVGCGKGTFLKLAKKFGWQAMGIEPNFEDAERLKRESGIVALPTDFFSACLPENEFDVVSLWDLIEHVPNPVEWVERCYKMIRAGGLLVIATPNHSSLLDLLALLGYRLSFGNFIYALEKLYTIDHTLYFTKKTLGHLLERQGFVISKCIQVNTDLERYAMSPAFRFISETLLALSQLLCLQNRIILFARKNG